MKLVWDSIAFFILVGTMGASAQDQAFPALIPLERPADRPLSAAMQRLYDEWNPHEDRGNELYSNFKYSRLEGLSYEGNTSRRDPSKVLRSNGTYYVWYTRRKTLAPPSGPKKATETVPSFDLDLGEVWLPGARDAARVPSQAD